MAPVTNRFKISSAGSTSSMGTGVVCFKSEQPPQGGLFLQLIVNQMGVLFKQLEIVGPHRLLQKTDRIRCPEMPFAVLCGICNCRRWVEW